MSRPGLASIRAVDEAESALAENYIKRVAALRRARGLKQREMAELLGISLARYKKYEKRSLLPPYLIGRFASIVGRDIEHVVTGRSARPRPTTPKN